MPCPPDPDAPSSAAEGVPRPPLRALILAAGRGERMRPLTDQTPKPLLPVRGRPLIEWHLLALRRAGVREVVINTAWLEPQFPAALGDGARFGLSIHYSQEGRENGGALETAGGIAKALPRLGSIFWVVAGDVFVPGFDFDPGAARALLQTGRRQAHLWLVPNAPHHPQGDFAIDATGLARSEGSPRYTWASVGLFSASLFDGIAVGTRLALTPLLRQAAAQGQLGAELWTGQWTDVGTLARLQALNEAP